ncbi:MAG: hypothetical protein HS115_16985 [Spirochaetales bacterium]|nr:hypothetical protein [Spirochaetales bacterium]
MNTANTATEVKAALKDLAAQPLELLDRKSLESLAKTLSRLQQKIITISDRAALQRMEAAVPLEDRPLFAAILKSLSKGKKTLRHYEMAAARSRELSREIRPRLQKLRSMDETAALAFLGALGAEERLHFSLLASVTGSKGQLLKLTAARKNQLEWWRGLHLK